MNLKNSNMRSNNEVTYILNIFKKHYKNYINSRGTKFPPHIMEIIADPLFKFKDRGTTKKYAIKALSEVTGSNKDAKDIFDIFWGIKRPKLPLEIVQKFFIEINKHVDSYIQDSSYKPPALRRIGAKYNVTPYQKYTKRHLVQLFGKKEGMEIYHKIWSTSDLKPQKKKSLKNIIKQEIEKFRINNNYKAKSLSLISQEIDIAVSTVVIYAKNILRDMGLEDIYSEMWISEHLGQKKIKNIKKHLQQEIKKSLKDSLYNIPSQAELADQLGVSRDTIQKRAKEVLNDSYQGEASKIYSKMWSPNKLTETQIKKMKNSLNKQIQKYLKDNSYSPPSLEEIAGKLEISKSSLWRYAFKHVPNILYKKFWERKDPTPDQIESLKNLIKQEVNNWLFRQNYEPTTLTDIASRSRVAPGTAINYANKILKKRFGNETNSIFNRIWSHFLSDDKIKEICKILQEEVDKWLKNNDYIPISLNQLANNLGVSVDSVQTYGMKYLKKKFGIEIATDLYISIWLDNQYFWKYIGLKVHNILNSFFSRYFDTLDIRYFSEVKIFPGCRYDGFILNDLLFPNNIKDDKLIRILNSKGKFDELLNTSQLNFNKIKGLALDFTFDSSPSNIGNKIDKYFDDSLLFFIISLDELSRNRLENHSQQIKIIGVNQLLDLVKVSKSEEKYISKIFRLADSGELKQLMLDNLPSEVTRRGIKDLRNYLLEMGLIQKNIKEYFSKTNFKNLTDFF
jgi:biotin operon repressor